MKLFHIIICSCMCFSSDCVDDSWADLHSANTVPLSLPPLSLCHPSLPLFPLSVFLCVSLPLSPHLSVFLSSCLSICLSTYLSAFRSLPVCLSERYNFLGISIVGQSNDRGDGGIYIGSIMKGGAVAADGRIEPGDMLLQVLLQYKNTTTILLPLLQY